MMKKTLLSIMTMAALLSATSVSAAGPVSKDITVEAKITEVITLTKANNSRLDNIKLTYDVDKNDGSYTNSTDIKIMVTNSDPKVNIKLAEEFKLIDSSGLKKFTDHSVTLGGQKITTANTNFDLEGNQSFSGSLIINAKQPVGAVGTYSGTLKLVLESEA